MRKVRRKSLFGPHVRRMDGGGRGDIVGEEGSGGIHFRFFGKSIGVGPPDLLCVLQF